MPKFNFFHVTEATTLDDIFKQYKELAKKYHPDMHTQEASKEKFQELQTEYAQVLDYLKRLDFEQDRLKEEQEVDVLIGVFVNKYVTNPLYKPLATEGLKLFVQILK